jgi:hypothetical protein
MRKIALFMAVVAAAAMPSIAEAAKKGKKRVARAAAQTTQPVQRPVDTNEASARLVRGAIPIFLPTWALPIYFSTPVGKADHPHQNPHILNPQGSNPQLSQQQQTAAKQSRRVKRAKR